MASRIYRAINKTLWRFSLNNPSEFVIPARCYRDFNSILKRRLHTTLCLEGVQEVKMPSLSPTMAEGTIIKWIIKEGDTFVAGDALCEIQTDKAVVTLDCDEDGILAKILKPADSGEIKVGTLIALTVGEGEDWKNVEIPASAAETSAPSAPKTEQPKSSSSTTTPADAQSSPGLLGPAVKSLLTQHGLQARDVQGSGPRGMVLKGDVVRHVTERKLQPVKQDIRPPEQEGGRPSAKELPSAAAYIDLEVTSMRKTIAKRLLHSKMTVPHSYAVVSCRVNKVAALRKQLLSVGIKISVNDLFIKLVGNTLARCPAINVIWEGETIVNKGTIDISVAVATDKGLITPIVTDVMEKDVLHISEEMKLLAERTKSGKLQPHEFMGGTFTISNLGMFGIHHFSAIINPPQCAILAIGGLHFALEKNGDPVTRTDFTLSYDGYAIPDVTAGKFLAHLKHEVENASEVSLGIYNLQHRIEMRDVDSTN